MEGRLTSRFLVNVALQEMELAVNEAGYSLNTVGRINLEIRKREARVWTDKSHWEAGG